MRRNCSHKLDQMATQIDQRADVCSWCSGLFLQHQQKMASMFASKLTTSDASRQIVSLSVPSHSYPRACSQANARGFDNNQALRCDETRGSFIGGICTCINMSVYSSPTIPIHVINDRTTDICVEVHVRSACSSLCMMLCVPQRPPCC